MTSESALGLRRRRSRMDTDVFDEGLDLGPAASAPKDIAEGDERWKVGGFLGIFPHR